MGLTARPTKQTIGLGNVDNTSDDNKPISTATQAALDAKQNTLVSGDNIRTINGSSLLGSGNLAVSANLVASTTALASVTPSNGLAAIVTDEYELGVFVFSNANLSSQVSADTDKAIYVAPSSDNTGASGAWVRRVENGTYLADWWLKGDSTIVQDTLNRALKQIPAGSTLLLPPREMTCNTATPGTVQRGSSSFLSGVTGAIYLDKPVRLVGHGYATHLNLSGQLGNVIMVRASNCYVGNLRAGNCAGQLSTSESAGVCFQTSNWPQTAGSGFDIENLVVENCHFYNCDSGVTGVPDRNFGDDTLWRVGKLKVINCRITGCRRQGVELFNCDNSLVTQCYFEGADKTIYSLSRFVRAIGARNFTVTENIANGFSDSDTGYIGVQIETAGFYGYPPHYEMCSDGIVANNRMHGFGCHVQIEESQGSVIIANNIFTNDHSTNAIYAIRINSAGVRNPSGNSTNKTNKSYIEQIFISGNTGRGQSHFILCQGTVYLGEAIQNKFISNEATAVHFASLDILATHPLEHVDVFAIAENVALLNPAVTTSPISVAGLKAGDRIFVDDNKMTPNSTGGFITHNGLGAVQARDPYSNIKLDTAAWSDNFDPPRGPIFGEPNE